jgi:hypothetical protein
VRQQPCLLLQLLVGGLQSSWRLCNSCASVCDWISRSFRPGVGLDRVDHDADRFRQLVEERLVDVA